MVLFVLLICGAVAGITLGAQSAYQSRLDRAATYQQFVSGKHSIKDGLSSGSDVAEDGQLNNPKTYNTSCTLAGQSFVLLVLTIGLRQRVRCQTTRARMESSTLCRRTGLKSLYRSRASTGMRGFYDAAEEDGIQMDGLMVLGSAWKPSWPSRLDYGKTPTMAPQQYVDTWVVCMNAELIHAFVCSTRSPHFCHATSLMLCGFLSRLRTSLTTTHRNQE